MALDNESGFLWALCGANQANQQIVAQRRITSNLFQTQDAAAAFVFSYHDKYGKYPTTQVLKSRYPQISGGKEPLAYYTDQLLERHTYQGLREIITKVTKLMQTDDSTALAQCAREMAGAQELLKHGYSMDSTWAEWDAYENYRTREQTGVIWKTPYRLLNRCVRGFRAKQLVTLVGRPATCKSWLMLMFAVAAWEQGANVLFIPKEMGAAEIYERLDALMFDMDWIAYLNGKIPLAVMKQHGIDRKKVLAQRKNQFVVSDTEDLGANDVGSVRDKIVEHRPDCVYVDGAYLLDEAKGKTLTEKWGNISRTLKRVARAENVMLQQSLQFNRAYEESQDALNNIYGSDSPAMDSDVVLEVKGKRTDDTRQINLLKARTQTTVGMGSFYVSARFAPKVDLREIGAVKTDAKTVAVSTTDG